MIMLLVDLMLSTCDVVFHMCWYTRSLLGLFPQNHFLRANQLVFLDFTTLSSNCVTCPQGARDRPLNGVATARFSNLQNLIITNSVLSCLLSIVLPRKGPTLLRGVNIFIRWRFLSRT